jgi:regulator of cell morphogenesis and NO signaling
MMGMRELLWVPALPLVTEASLTHDPDLVVEPADWAERSPVELVEYVMDTYHGPLIRGMSQLEALLKTAARAEPNAYLVLHAVMDEVHGLKADLDHHLKDEELTLFALVRAGFIPRGDGMYQSLRADHARERHTLDRIRALCLGCPVPTGASGVWHAAWSGLANLDEATREHLDLEDRYLLRRYQAD